MPKLGFHSIKKQIAEGAITAGYVQVVGQIDQTALNLQADDYGGEEDPHGADCKNYQVSSDSNASRTHACRFFFRPWQPSRLPPLLICFRQGQLE